MSRFSCGQFLETIRIQSDYYEEFAGRETIVPRWEDNNLQVDLVHGRLSPSTLEKVTALQPLSCRILIDLWLCGEIAANGPKIFQPSLAQCLALEQVALTIPINEYTQPYSVMIVELPEDYRRIRICSGNSTFHVGEHAPEAVIVGFHPPPVASIWLQILLSSSVRVTLAVLPGDVTMEDRIRIEFGEDSYAQANEFTVGERMVTAGLVRLAINTMMLLVDFGCKHAGPANPSHFHRLERHLRAAKKRRSGIKEAERNLRWTGQLYVFAQDIVLHNEETHTASESASDDAIHRRPHWRRGHWKMQAHGAGRSLRKRTFIKPVLVNRALLAGEKAGSPATTTYRLAATQPSSATAPIAPDGISTQSLPQHG